MANPCGVSRTQHDSLYDTLFLEDGEYYEIPYRCPPTKDADNLLISGRCISADHDAILDALEAEGATVDRAGRIVPLPEELVDRAARANAACPCLLKDKPAEVVEAADEEVGRSVADTPLYSRDAALCREIDQMYESRSADASAKEHSRWNAAYGR